MGHGGSCAQGVWTKRVPRHLVRVECEQRVHVQGTIETQLAEQCSGEHPSGLCV